MKCTLIQTFDPSSPTRTNSTQLVWVSGKSPNRWKIDIDLIFVCWYLYSCYTRVEKHKTRREGKQITLTPPQLHTTDWQEFSSDIHSCCAHGCHCVGAGHGAARLEWATNTWRDFDTLAIAENYTLRHSVGFFFSLRWTSSERWWCTELRRAQK